MVTITYITPPSANQQPSSFPPPSKTTEFPNNDAQRTTVLPLSINEAHSSYVSEAASVPIWARVFSQFGKWIFWLYVWAGFGGLFLEILLYCCDTVGIL